MQPAFQPARLFRPPRWLFSAAIFFLCAGLIAASPRISAAQCPTFARMIEVATLADAGPGSLRSAIAEANLAGADVVVSFTTGGTINLASELPVLSASSVSIDASAAPAPGVVINGGGMVSNGLLVEGSDVCVRGLTFQNFRQDGLRIRGLAAQGDRVEEVVSLNNGDDGLQVSEEASATLVGNLSQGNGNKGLLVFAGGAVVAENNTLARNGDGVTVSNGSSAIFLGNLIADNDDNGIGLTSGSQGEITGNLILNNGSVGPNSEGIRMTKGSQAEITGNEIRGSGDKGIVVMGKSRASIINNEIRESVGDGILLAFSAQVIIEANEIRLNGGNGIRIAFKAVADIGGGGESAGENSIELNDGFEVTNETANAISALGNKWGVLTAAELDATEIYDDDEDPALGKVDFVPRFGEADWDDDDLPDSEDPCPHLAGVIPGPLDLRGTQMVRSLNSDSTRGLVRFKGVVVQDSVPPPDPGRGDGFYLTIRHNDGSELTTVILPGGYPWVRSRGRNQWHYRVSGRQRVRSYLREVGAPGNGRYRVSVDYMDIPLINFPPSGSELLQYSLEFVATGTCYHTRATQCWPPFIPPVTHLCR